MDFFSTTGCIPKIRQTNVDLYLGMVSDNFLAVHFHAIRVKLNYGTCHLRIQCGFEFTHTKCRGPLFDSARGWRFVLLIIYVHSFLAIIGTLAGA